jgi:predicted small lipoprotein YifL
MKSMRKFWFTSLLVAAMSLTGCTLYGPKNPPTLKTTTSAEQYQRLFFQAVKAKNQQQLPGMLAANVMYSAGGKVMNKEETLAYLQGMNLSDFTMTDVVVKPNGPDMTLSFTLQKPSQTTHAIAVWQQVSSGWILTAYCEGQ